ERVHLQKQIILKKIADGASVRRFTICSYTLPDANRRCTYQHHEKSGSGRQRHAIAPGKFTGTVNGRRAHSKHRLVIQVATDVGSKIRRRAVAARAVLLQRLKGNGIEIAVDFSF